MTSAGAKLSALSLFNSRAPWSTLVSSGFRSACAVAAVVTLSLINLAITTTDVSSFKIEVPTTINRNKNRKCLGGL